MFYYKRIKVIYDGRHRIPRINNFWFGQNSVEVVNGQFKLVDNPDFTSNKHYILPVSTNLQTTADGSTYNPVLSQNQVTSDTNTIRNLVGRIQDIASTDYLQIIYWYRYGGETTEVIGNYKDSELILDSTGVNGHIYIKLRPVNEVPYFVTPSQDLNLGGIKQAFEEDYIFNDKDTDQNLTVNITKTWKSGTEQYTNVLRNTRYSTGITAEEFNQLELNEEHRITIHVTDGNQGNAYRYITFRRTNTAPNLTIENRNIGEQNDPFEIPFTVSDFENDVVNVEFLYLGKTLGKIENITKDSEQVWTISNEEFYQITNGKHAITVNAIDINGASTPVNVEFTKNVHGLDFEDYEEVDKIVDYMIVVSTHSLATDGQGNFENISLQVTNNYLDDSPVWEDAEFNKIHNFSNSIATNPAVGIRVVIDGEPNYGESVWSSTAYHWNWR